MSGLVVKQDKVSVAEALIEQNVAAALEAIGIKSTELIIKMMQDGYHTPHGKDGHTAIWDTGDLQRDVQYEVDSDTVNVGNTLNYAHFVHEGTYKLEARPYIRDAITAGTEDLQKVAEAALKVGFD